MIILIQIFVSEQEHFVSMHQYFQVIWILFIIFAAQGVEELMLLLILDENNYCVDYTGQAIWWDRYGLYCDL